MRNILATYFYQDEEDLGAIYGNISLPLQQQNDVYWKTVYCLFASAIIVSKSTQVSYQLFTNVQEFPYRRRLEEMGVEVSADLTLTRRNANKWATVKYVFDVMRRIVDSDHYSDADRVVLLDTDVLCYNDVGDVFRRIPELLPMVYEVSDLTRPAEFHGCPLDDLEAVYGVLLGEDVRLSKAIGGEFFAGTKSAMRRFLGEYEKLASDPLITTEEQVFSLCHSRYHYNVTETQIARVWTSLSSLSIPKAWADYSLLHLPAEKASGFLRIFESLFGLDPLFTSVGEYRTIFARDISLHCPPLVFGRSLRSALARKWKSAKTQLVAKSLA